MEPQTLVRNTETGILGVVVTDPWDVCGDDEVPVVYEGQTGFSGTDRGVLEDFGPENAIADAEKCGAGKGAECCIFLTFKDADWTCQRFGGLRYQLIFAKERMSAKREPVEMFPNCQLPT